MSKKKADSQSNVQRSEINECTLYVEGMHCAACEILIEKKLSERENIVSTDIDVSQGTAKVKYKGEKLNLDSINEELSSYGYSVGEKISGHKDQKQLITIGSKGELLVNIYVLKRFLLVFTTLIVILGLFFLVNKTGLQGLVTVDSTSSLPMFFLFGLVAGSSTCAALVGGILLSMAKQWNENYASANSKLTRAGPHLLFHLGRLISFTILGGVLGLLGGAIQITPVVTALIVAIVSVAMLILGLQMLDVKWAYAIRLTLPKQLGRSVASKHVTNRFVPFIIGVLTFFLPCGFTIVAQGVALSSGSFLSGALIMLMFALGTLPVLGAISIGSLKFGGSIKVGSIFNKVAGLLVIFFALFNLNAQLNVIGLPSLNDMFRSELGGGIEVIEGYQVIRMEASALGYSPNSFTIQSGIPAKWIVEDTGTSGCTNAIIASGLFDGQFVLKRGLNEITFTPEIPGQYKFSCWMGMVSGVIEVI